MNKTRIVMGVKYKVGKEYYIKPRYVTIDKAWRNITDKDVRPFLSKGETLHGYAVA